MLSQHGCEQNAEGRQLLLEAVALVGALLLALDRRTDGAVRERSVVAYYRLKGGAQARAPLTPCQKCSSFPCDLQACIDTLLTQSSWESGLRIVTVALMFFLILNNNLALCFPPRPKTVHRMLIYS